MSSSGASKENLKKILTNKKIMLIVIVCYFNACIPTSSLLTSIGLGSF
jgi:hypothetical protein